MNSLKLIFLGPVASGKSYITNFLSDAVEQGNNEYRPTKGVRILEYDLMAKHDSKMTKVELQLWDTSGSKRYQNCWPVIFNGAHGVVLVYNADQPDHANELDEWYKTAISQSLVRDANCCLMQHALPQTTDKNNVELSQKLSNLTIIKSRIPSHGDSLREAFSKYVGRLLSNLSEATEKEELTIITS
ncbi:ras-related protein rab-5 [Echinococcus multilocularis]|uniref:Ras-related protein rab-5 n=1 Tax=Echinococcus multilocularis TaxID=6211 RepID=A0A068YDH6_ECHMU|nr:ras-related protein rab-5 [Echinococcus multilocularis]